MSQPDSDRQHATSPNTGEKKQGSPTPPPESPATQFGSDQEEGVRKPKTALDWNGPTDRENPQNWPSWRKWFQVWVISGIAFIGTFASSAFTLGLEQAASEFHVGRELGVLAYSIYVLGLGFGGPIASPLSETHGRKAVYLSSMPIFALMIMGTGFANNIVALLFLRFLAGFFGAPSLSIGAASVSDMFTPEARSAPIGLYIMTPFLGPALGPLLGGFVTTGKGWRWTSWLILFATVLVLTPAIFLKETYKKIILQRRATRLNTEGPPGIKANRTTTQTVRFFIRSTLIRPLHMLFTEPVVASFCFYVAYNFALIYAFFAAFPGIWQTTYGYSLDITGVTFLGLAVGCLIATAIIHFFNTRIYKPKVVRAVKAGTDVTNATSRIAPEHRLYLAMAGGPMITAGLYLFGWTAAYRVHWIAPVIAEALFSCGNQIVFMAASMYMTDVCGPLFGASAMAGNTMLRYLLGGVFPLFSVQMFEGLGTQWACTLLGCVSAVGMCILFVLYRWGPVLRARSGYRRGS